MRKTKQEMYPLVAEYDRSGLSVRKFCNDKRIKESTFVYWLRKSRKERSASSSFMALKLEGRVGNSYAVEVERSDGTCYRFRDLVPVQYIEALLSER